jgi:hypothetical protein
MNLALQTWLLKMLADGQTIPVSHRDSNAFIAKDTVTEERMMTEISTLNELQKDSQADPETNSVSGS